MASRTVLAAWSAALIGAALTISGCSSCFPGFPGPERFSDYVGSLSPAGPTATTSPSTMPSGDPMFSGPASGPAGAPLKLSIAQAILMGLENNKSLVVDRFNPQLARAFEEGIAATWDPIVNYAGSKQFSRVPTVAPGSSHINWEQVENTAALLGISALTPTGGSYAVTASTNLNDPASATGDTTRLELAVTQSLLRGAGLDVNLATLRQARLDTLSSQYELRGFAQTIVSNIEQAYWLYALAIKQIAIFEDSYKLAQKQLDETNVRIQVGKLPESERAAAEAELARREQDKINGQNNLILTRYALLRAISPPGGQVYDRDVTLTTDIGIPASRLENVERYVQVALRLRPDLNQARLLVQRGDLELVKTRNGLLPRLDVFVTLGKTGYADSFGESVAHFGNQGADATIGFTGDWSPLNRAALALNKGAQAKRDQSAAAVDNLSQLVELDVRAAYIQVIRYRAQIEATAATRRFQEETLRAETEKFNQGKSTSLLVSQAARDLLSAQIDEVSAIAAYRNAIVDLYRLDGSLLLRRGVAAPGDKPVNPGTEYWR